MSSTISKVYQNDYITGLKHGIPIALGYLSVSLTIGMAAVNQGLPVWSAILISLTNLTSAGQVAGIAVIAAQGSFIEMVMTEFIINLRYALMSLSWSQKLDERVTLPERFLVAFGNTDEIFAVSSAQPGTLGTKYLLGLMTLPYIGWGAGTAIGALLSEALPDNITSAFSVAVYGMFLAIIIPAAKKEWSVFMAIIFSVTLSCSFHFLPFLKNIGSGFVIIICAVVSSAIAALLWPVPEKEMINPLKKKTDEDTSHQEVPL